MRRAATLTVPTFSSEVPKKKKAPVARTWAPVLPNLKSPRRNALLIDNVTPHEAPTPKLVDPTPIAKPARKPRPHSSPPITAKMVRHFANLGPQPPSPETPEHELDPYEAYFRAVEKKIERAFEQDSPHFKTPAAPPPRPFIEERPDISPGEPVSFRARPNIRFPSLPQNGAVGIAASPFAVAATPVSKQQAKDSNKEKASADMLAKLLDKLAPAPFDDEPMETPQRLASSGEGQQQLKKAINENLRRVIDLFRQLDADGSGAVDRMEFRKGIRDALGVNAALHPDDELDELFESIDTSRDGLIQYRELHHALMHRADGRLLSAGKNRKVTAVPPISVFPPGGQGGAQPRSPVDAPNSNRPPARRVRASSASSDSRKERHRSATAALQNAVNIVLHPLKRREVLKLYLEFKTQHEDGVCKVRSFDQLLKLTYPTETKQHREAMVKVAADHEAQAAKAAAAQAERQRDAQALFEALDVDNSGMIDMNEFLRLQSVGGLQMSRAELKALFHAKDADGNGTLDIEEFKQLCADSKLLEHKQAILSSGNAAKAKAEADAQAHKDLWQLGLPKEKPKPKDEGPKERPSLVGVAAAIANMRRAMGSVADGAAPNNTPRSARARA